MKYLMILFMILCASSAVALIATDEAVVSVNPDGSVDVTTGNATVNVDPDGNTVTTDDACVVSSDSAVTGCAQGAPSTSPGYNPDGPTGASYGEDAAGKRQVTVDAGPDGTMVNTPGANVTVGHNGDVMVETAGATIQHTNAGTSVAPMRFQNRLSEQEMNQVREGFADDEIEEISDVFTESELEDVKQVFVNREVNMAQVKTQTVAITMTGNKVSVNGVEGETQKKVRVQVNGNEVEVENDGTKVQLRDGDLRVEVPGAEVTQNRIRVEGVEIKMPSEIAPEKGEVTDIQIETDGAKVQYKVKTQDQQRVLGMFKATVNKDITIDATTGEQTESKGPWWDFLAW